MDSKGVTRQRGFGTLGRDAQEPGEGMPRGGESYLPALRLLLPVPPFLW